MKNCLCCQESFSPKPGTRGLFCSLLCTGKYNGAQRSLKTEKAYYASPKLCKCCNSVIPYEQRKTNIFCSMSCAGTYNAKHKDYTSFKPGPKKGYIPKNAKPKKIEYVGPFTRIYLCKCKITGLQWYSTTVKTIHPTAIENKKLYSYQCRFTFSIRDYPNQFEYASKLIKEHGWYSASNRGNNLNGCSRDHLYSVSDGFINSVDPKIISHPANCQVIPHRKNQSKNKKSVITLDELHERIKQFENVEASVGV